ncbi:MAG: SRPBCC domain-containing protein [Gemmatimonadota bacterium]
MTGTNSMDFSVHICAPRETVFPFLAEPEGFAAWMGAGSSIGGAPGDTMRVEYPNGVQALGEVVEVDPPRRIAFTWGFANNENDIAPGETLVTITLDEVPDGTLLTLRHERFATPDQATAHRGGWRYYLALLTEAASAATYDGTLAHRVEAFIDAWGEADVERRREILQKCVTDDIVFRDGIGYTHGLDDLIGHISAALRFMPGLSLEGNGAPRRTHEVAVFGWRVRDPDGAVVAAGDNVARLAPDGRFREVVGVKG